MGYYDALKFPIIIERPDKTCEVIDSPNHIPIGAPFRVFYQGWKAKLWILVYGRHSERSHHPLMVRRRERKRNV
jgi:hypothetical protein